MYKGHDRAMVIFAARRNESNDEIPETVDEIKQFLDCRYASTSEAFWRSFKFDMHARFPAAKRLQCHLPDLHTALLSEDDDPQQVVGRPTILSTLMALFAANADASMSAVAQELSYNEYPQHFVWIQW